MSNATTFLLKHIDPERLYRKYKLACFLTDNESESSSPIDVCEAFHEQGTKAVMSSLEPLTSNLNAVEVQTLSSATKEDTLRPLKTRIADITDREENYFYSFLDESKKNHQCIVTMKSYLTQEELPRSTTLHCFWCRHSFHTIPIGCPIEYVPPRASKSYNSEITKDKYILRGDLTKKQFEEFKRREPPALEEYQMVENDFYLMDGLFCSFNCCLAYIKANLSNPLYMQSEFLLHKIYVDLFGSQCMSLVEAPSWRLLKNYGGHISIEDFRKNFYRVEYNDFENIVYPIAKSQFIGFLFEKQIKL